MHAEKQNELNIHIPQIKQMKIVEERKGGESRILSLIFYRGFWGIEWKRPIWFILTVWYDEKIYGFPNFQNEFHTKFS